MRMLLGALAMLILISRPLQAAGRPMTVEDLLAVKGVSDPQVSPDGKRVVYVVAEIDRESNKTNKSLWMVPVAGGPPRRLTTTPGSNDHPRWSPDGTMIAFVSDRSGSSQIWLLPLDGGEPRALTHLPIDVAGPIWSPRGDALAFVAEVYPSSSPEETAKRDKEKAEAKSKARIYDSLMIRHWSTWDEGKRSHLFVCDVATGTARDLTKDWKVNIPPAPFGGSSDYAWSPDGTELAFTSEPLVNPAWSTNTDVWTVPANGGEPANRTEANRGADSQPAYSPDGKWLAHLSQERAGFEADQWVLRLLDRQSGRLVDVTKALDRSVLSYEWEKERTLIAVIDHAGMTPLVRFHVGPEGNPHFPPDLKAITLLEKGAIAAAHVASGTGTIILARSQSHRPAEIERITIPAATPNSRPAEPVALTHHNDDLIAQLDLAPAESFTFQGADGDTVQGFLVRPPGFDAAKKYPVLQIIHGGPQVAQHDDWHARWNLQLFAAPGYAVVAINPRGSPGFGQRFVDQISRDWNGKVYQDLMLGLDHALKSYPFLDRDRLAAAGGSFGGYMINWIAGHTDRYRCLISHAGIFDLFSMNATTEELWFSEWEFGGSPWQTLERQIEQSPSTYVAQFKTPTLVIHGALDFRVPDAQGLGMFTALQRQGVPSRFLYFPDEGHWVLKAPNRVVWWREMHQWLAAYLKAEDR